MLDVVCPCCQATLKIDPNTQAVISHQAKPKPRPIEDLSAAVAALKGESARREEVFQKQLAEQRTHHAVLDRKFDELLRQAKQSPDTGPRTKDIDLD